MYRKIRQDRYGITVVFAEDIVIGDVIFVSLQVNFL